MKRLETIQFLLDEIKRELEYKHGHAKAVAAARRKAADNGDQDWSYRKYMPTEFWRDPKQAVIVQNAKTIRRLLLGYYEAQR